jgi:hypothetical protein
MPGGYTIKHRDEFESMEGSGEATWLLARKALGTSAFGFNLVTFASIEPPASRMILNRSGASVTAMLIGVSPGPDFRPASFA